MSTEHYKLSLDLQKEYIDKFIIANTENNIKDLIKYKTISLSICDATAIYPVLKIIDKKLSIINGHITTVHPWLSYQNLIDGPVFSNSIPSSYWSDFQLGRKSTEALIPKSTSVLEAIKKVNKNIAEKFTCFSYRSPHPIVSSAICNINVNEKISPNYKLNDLFNKSKNHIDFSDEFAISTDYIANQKACVIEKSQIKISNKMISLMLWYDNEFGYCYQIHKTIKKIRNF